MQLGLLVWACKQVHWAQDDSEGRPVLVVHLAAALRQDTAGAKRAAEAILTHMEYALQQRMRDDLSGPEQVVVVLDSRGAPTLQVILALISALSRLQRALHVSRNDLIPSALQRQLKASIIGELRAILAQRRARECIPEQPCLLISTREECGCQNM